MVAHELQLLFEIKPMIKSTVKSLYMTYILVIGFFIWSVSLLYRYYTSGCISVRYHFFYGNDAKTIAYLVFCTSGIMLVYLVYLTIQQKKRG